VDSINLIIEIDGVLKCVWTSVLAQAGFRAVFVWCWMSIYGPWFL